MDNFILNIYSSGSSDTLIKQPMESYPRLFYGNELYIYNLRGSLFKVFNSSSLVEIIPDGVQIVPAITSIPDGQSSNTIIFCGQTITDGDAQFALKYAAYPESVWTSGSAFGAGFSPVDSISDYEGAINALTGNQRAGTYDRIIASSGVEPYPMSKSDTGIPTTALLTDLELAE